MSPETRNQLIDGVVIFVVLLALLGGGLLLWKMSTDARASRPSVERVIKVASL